MMNKIDELRAEIRLYFDPQNLQDGGLQTTYSPGKKFRLLTSRYRQTRPELNWYVTKVEIFNNATEEKLFDFLANSDFFHDWLNVKGAEYLVGAENMYGGQTVIDLTNQRMASYSPGEDGFIWTEFSLSPEGKTLATIGCVWAAPYEIRLYDFSEPMNLPLKELKWVQVIGEETFDCWLDEKSLKTKGIETEYEEVPDGNGNVTFKETGITKVIARVISIE